MSLLGLPWTFWGVACLAVGVINTIFYPRAIVASALPLQAFIIRWAHPFLWVLLAISCFLRSSPRFTGIANILAASAGIIYLAFIVAMISARGR